jgi:hypothetical protein
MNDIVILDWLPDYGIGNDGRVWSFISHRWLNNKSKTTRGYPQVRLRLSPGKHNTFLTHRLVAEAWLGRPVNGQEVNHIDGDKTNNHVSNLEWITNAENMRHAAENGLMPVGEGHRLSKVTERDVLAIRRAYSGGESQVSIANRYPISRAMVGFIVRRENWKHV